MAISVTKIINSPHISQNKCNILKQKGIEGGGMPEQPHTAISDPEKIFFISSSSRRAARMQDLLSFLTAMMRRYQPD